MWTVNLQTNVSQSILHFSIHQFLRIVIIVGGYALLRPYLLQLGARFQARDHERELDPNEASSDAAVSPRSLRGQIIVPDDTDDDDDDEDEDGRSSVVNWGRRARRRQREMVRKILDKEEERLMSEQVEADSDKDIEEFLLTDDNDTS